MANERREQIIQIVNQQHKVAVTDLAQRTQVSLVTMRKDLTDLEAEGLLHRQHGFAVVNTPDDLNYRLAQHHEEKQRIAVAAAKLVADNTTIMIESGSACALLADTLGQQEKRVTIVTNSYYIANFVSSYPNLDVFVLGGKYQPESQVVVGSLTKQLLQSFHVEQLFVGTDGFDQTNGFSGANILRTEAAQEMAQRADSLIVLTDASKFQKPSLIQQFPLDTVTTVITDNGIAPVTADFLRQQSLNLTVV